MFKKTLFALLASVALSAQADNFGFEAGTTAGWTSNTLTAVGSQTVQAGSNTWTINPYGNYMGSLQIQSGSFANMTAALGLSSGSVSGITTLLQQQAAVNGGNPNPTTAGWVTRTVNLTAGTQFSLAWQYVSVDYVPFNDGSIATLSKVGSTNTTVVNNYNSQYALLGFTNPGTGDYSTGSYGATGWQVATFNVTESGSYLLGFGVFNLGDTALSPILFVDELQGTTTKNGQTFGAVAPNNNTAPSATPPSPPPAPTIVSTSVVYQIAIAEMVNSSQVPVTTVAVSHEKSKAAGVQTINRTTAVSTDTQWVRNITTTPVTTTTYSDSTTTTTTGTPTTTTENFNVIQTATGTDSFSGRADQAEQLDIIMTGIYRNLNRQSAKNGVADKYGRMAINANSIRYTGTNGYTGRVGMFGVAYEKDIDKQTTLGFQVNDIRGTMNGQDTPDASLSGTHVGVYLDHDVNGFTIQSDIANVNMKSSYTRTIGPFVNQYNGKSNITWASTRVYVPEMYGFRPFVGGSIFKANSPAVAETGSEVSSQTIAAVNKTSATGELGLNYSKTFNDVSINAEVARTTTGIREASLSLTKKNDNVLITVGVGKNWIQGTTSDIVGANIKVTF